MELNTQMCGRPDRPGDPHSSGDRFLKELEAAAYAEHGVEKYGAW